MMAETPHGAPAKPLNRMAIALGSLVAVLFLFSLYLSLNRIFQVDEAQNVFMAKVTGSGQFLRYYTNGSIFLLGPLSWITRTCTSSFSMFESIRGCFFVVYWVNLSLIAVATGMRIRSRGFVLALLGAATLAPLLDYGIEIRHDNLLLTGLLLSWVIVRAFPWRPAAGFAALGFIAGLMQFLAFKSFLYWGPLTAFLWALPPTRLRTGWSFRVGAWLGGAALAILAAYLAYRRASAWDAFLIGFRTALSSSSTAERFSPWISFQRILVQLPLLTALACAAAWRLGANARQAGMSAFSWDGAAPEALAFTVSLLAFLANPAPYPYNLVLLVPFLFIWVMRAQSCAAEAAIPHAIWEPKAVPFLGGLLVITHLVPFTTAALRHLDHHNDRQQTLMAMAENLTDPVRDPVFDAAGLVPTRNSIGYQWFLHSLVMQRFQNGQLPPLRQTLEAQSPPVFIRNYRTDWMGPTVDQFLQNNYLPLADDFLVLGKTFPEGGGTFHCLHGGRYLVRLQDPRGTIKVDGNPLDPSGIVRLEPGSATLTSPSPGMVQILWMGPSLVQPLNLADANHHALFVNWY